jgi:hypothetical protein
MCRQELVLGILVLLLTIVSTGLGILIGLFYRTCQEAMRWIEFQDRLQRGSKNWLMPNLPNEPLRIPWTPS